MSERSRERIIKGICEKVLRKVTPSEKEKEEVLQFSENLAKKLTEEMQRTGIEAEAQVQGSIAKDTWLAGEKDVDMFILLPKTYTKEIFLRVLDVVKALVGEKWLEAYAEHPYVEAEVEGYKIDFVPCFKIERPEEAISSVDRTPLHTSYIKRHLDQQTKNEVRLLKRFMRGIDTYGAEIKVGGFSGYLCELLVLHYGLFIDVLKPIANWKRDKIIDKEGYYKGREREARKIFEEPFVVVDPVDKGRNVASAVRRERLNEFIAAVRAFLKSPSLRFFYPREIEALDANELVQAMKTRGSAVVFVKFGGVKAVPDVLWGQLYKSQRSLRKMLQQHDFNILHDCAWSDEQTLNVLIFEVEQRFLPPIKKHLGPPIEKREECEKFLQKHLGVPHTVSGPRMENGRWVAEIKRRYIDVTKLLIEKLADGGRRIGVAELISCVIPNTLAIMVNEEILDLYSSNNEFAKFLTEFLRGRPLWLDG